MEALRFSGAVERCSFHSSICLYEIAVCGQLHSRRCAPFATVPCLHNLASTDSRLVFPVQDVEWFFKCLDCHSVVECSAYSLVVHISCDAGVTILPKIA